MQLIVGPHTRGDSRDGLPGHRSSMSIRVTKGRGTFARPPTILPARLPSLSLSLFLSQGWEESMRMSKRFVLARGYAISRSYVQMNGILSASFYLDLIIIWQKGMNDGKFIK